MVPVVSTDVRYLPDTSCRHRFRRLICFVAATVGGSSLSIREARAEQIQTCSLCRHPTIAKKHSKKPGSVRSALLPTSLSSRFVALRACADGGLWSGGPIQTSRQCRETRTPISAVGRGSVGAWTGCVSVFFLPLAVGNKQLIDAVSPSGSRPRECELLCVTDGLSGLSYGAGECWSGGGRR